MKCLRQMVRLWLIHLSKIRPFTSNKLQVLQQIKNRKAKRLEQVSQELQEEDLRLKNHHIDPDRQT